MFADEADCKAGQATAAPLEDSRELSLRTCADPQSAVDTEQAECGMDGNDPVDTVPDCISLIVNYVIYGTPTPTPGMKPY